MFRDSLTRTKRETLSTPFCKRVYRPSPVLNRHYSFRQRTHDLGLLDRTSELKNIKLGHGMLFQQRVSGIFYQSVYQSVLTLIFSSIAYSIHRVNFFISAVSAILWGKLCEMFVITTSVDVTSSVNQLIPYKLAIALRPQICDVTSPYV